jgi:allantoinase
MKLIRNVMLASGNSFKKVNVLFDNAIQQIGVGNIENDSITEVFDFSDCIIIPGAVDMHTRILKGTVDDTKNLQKYSKLALSGGYTTLADMPYSTIKPIFKAEQIEYYQKLIENYSSCDIALWGNCDFSEFPYHLNSMYELWTAGVVGFIIMHPTPNALIEDMAYDDIMGLFDTIYDTDISFAFQGFDRDEPSDQKSDKERFIEQRLVSIRKILRRLQDNPLHFIGIYDKVSLELLNIAFRRADLTYSFPVQEMIPIIERFKLSGYIKDDPYSEFVKLLFDSMKNGKLYTLSTEAGSILQSEDPLLNQAFSGYNEQLLQWSVPWIFSELWKNHKATIQSCIRMTSENPAKRLGLFPMKGCIQKGSHADITILDPNSPVISDLLDANGNKISLSCSVKATFLRGEMYKPENKKKQLQGQFVRRYSTTRRKSNSSCWN